MGKCYTCKRERDDHDISILHDKKICIMCIRDIKKMSSQWHSLGTKHV